MTSLLMSWTKLLAVLLRLITLKLAEGGPEAFRDAIRRIAPCAVIQSRIGLDDDIERDILGSFFPSAKGGEIDPEDGLRVVHSMFHFMGCHRTQIGFTEQ